MAHLTTYSSCMTTDITYAKPESVKPSSCEAISQIQLKNGIYVDCKNKRVSLERGDDSTYYFAILNLVPGDAYKIFGEKQLISIKDINKIQFSSTGLNNVSLILIVASVFILGAAIAISLGLSQMNFSFGR